MLEGTYKVIVHNYTKRVTKDVGFDLEIECQNKIHSLTLNNYLK